MNTENDKDKEAKERLKALKTKTKNPKLQDSIDEKLKYLNNDRSIKK